MGVFRQFPYSNFHEMNMDEIIKIVKNMLEEWAQYHAEWDAWMDQMNDDWSNYQEVMNEAWQNMQDFINNYFDNLDVQEEINNKIIDMVRSGEFTDIVSPYIPPVITSWLTEHITQPVGVVIDTSLSVSGACADAKATGDAINDVKRSISDITESTRNLFNVNNVIIGKAWNNAENPDRAICFIPIEGSKKYTVTFNDISTFDAVGWFDKTSIGATTYISGGSLTNNDVITTDATATILAIQFNKTSISTSDFVGMNLQIEEGELPTNYIPPVTACDYILREKIGNYVTPEQYGAKCNGVDDDAVFINLALRSGFPVVLNKKTYTTATPIIIDSGNTLLDLGSTINYTGNDYAIAIGGRDGFYAEFNNIVSNAVGISLVEGSLDRFIQNGYLKFNEIESTSHCIIYHPVETSENTRSFVYYTKIFGNYISSDEGNAIDIRIPDGIYGLFNENVFSGFRIAKGNWGILFNCERADNYCDRITFDDIAFETPDQGIYLAGLWDSLFNNMRVKEVLNDNPNYHELEMHNCRRNTFTNIPTISLSNLTIGSDCKNILIESPIINAGYNVIAKSLYVDGNGNHKVELSNTDNFVQLTNASNPSYEALTPDNALVSYIPTHYVLSGVNSIIFDNKWYGYGRINDLVFYNNDNESRAFRAVCDYEQNFIIPAKTGKTLHWTQNFAILY